MQWPQSHCKCNVKCKFVYSATHFSLLADSEVHTIYRLRFINSKTVKMSPKPIFIELADLTVNDRLFHIKMSGVMRPVERCGGRFTLSKMDCLRDTMEWTDR
jgi:hypothetical protein